MTNPTALLQTLIRFNTTNPPGNELACVQYINGLLQDAGIETTLVAKESQRPNLIARLAGRGDAPPLLLQGHVDVVTTAGQTWRHDPFGGELIDDFVWGRGALDMKGGVAMLLSAFLRAKNEGVALPGDLILCILSDEEAGGEVGARFLVEEHPGLFDGVRYAIGEFGGFSLTVSGRRFYPIMVSEKQACRLELTVYGPGGHGSMPIRGGAMAKLGRVLTRLDQKRLPLHVTREAKLMFDALANGLEMPQKLLLGQLTNPLLAERVLDLLGDKRHTFAPLLHNTVSPTVVTGGTKINVHPSEIALSLDGRLLPRFTPNELVTELHALLGHDIAIRVTHYDPGPASVDMAEFDTLAQIIKELDHDGFPAPLLLSGVTDGRFFARLGIQTYGFLPMKLAASFNFSETIHAANERIPVEALAFGTEAIFRAVQRMQGNYEG